MYIHMCVCIYIYRNAYIDIHIHIFMNIYKCIYTINVCIYVNICIMCVYIFIKCAALFTLRGNIHFLTPRGCSWALTAGSHQHSATSCTCTGPSSSKYNNETKIEMMWQISNENKTVLSKIWKMSKSLLCTTVVVVWYWCNDWPCWTFTGGLQGGRVADEEHGPAERQRGHAPASVHRQVCGGTVEGRWAAPCKDKLTDKSKCP